MRFSMQNWLFSVIRALISFEQTGKITVDLGLILLLLGGQLTDIMLVYIPPPKPQLHGLGTAPHRTLNRTPPDVDRTYPNPV